MKLLNTKHKRDSAKITSLIVIILLLLLFVVGPNYIDPPEEYGVAVNFGTSNTGSGNKALSKPKQAPQETPTAPAEQTPAKTTPAEVPTAPKATAEDVITQTTEDATAIKKAKAAEAKALLDAKAKAESKAKAQAKAKADAKKAAEAQQRKAEAEKRKNLDNLIGGVKNAKGNDDGGEGSDNNAGNKGQINGNPYAPSYFGGSGPGKGGIGYGLGGRGKPTKKIFKQNCNEYGLVVVKVEVNRQGNVISATPGIKGTTNTHPCLLTPAKKIAESHKWPADTKAPATQIGFVSINFEIGQ